MKAYLPCIWVGLWLLGSCSTSDPTPDSEADPKGFPASYTIISHTGGSLVSSQYDGDVQSLEWLAEGPAFPPSALPLLWHQDSRGFSAVIRPETCSLRAVWMDLETGLLQEQPAFGDIDPCSIEIHALTHAEGKIYVAYARMEQEASPSFGLRSIDMADGSFLDIDLEAFPVDVARAGEHIFVLTRGEDSQNKVDIFNALNLDFVYGTAIGFEAELLLRLGSDRLLVGFPDAHLELFSSSLQIADNVQYQEGVEPGFSGQQPVASLGGDELYYRYRMEDDVEIGAVYRLSDRTAVLYDFKNFLSPDQREFQYDVGSATAVGYDGANDLLLIGYRKASSGGGGLLRLQVVPEFRFVDQLDLEAPPICILSR